MADENTPPSVKINVDPGIGELANSDLVKRVYDDAVAGPAKEAGNIGTDLMKSLRLFLVPFQLMAVAQDRLAVALDEIRRGVPPDRQKDAPPEIAFPAMQQLVLTSDGSPLRSMYVELLRRAIDRERESEAHPAFVWIISQLHSDEALILWHLKQRNFRVVEQRPFDAKTRTFGESRGVSNEFPLHELAYPDNFTIYMNHLHFLNVAGWPAVEDVPTFEGDPGVQTGLTTTLLAQPTRFGAKFAAACVPDEWPKREDSRS